MQTFPSRRLVHVQFHRPMWCCGAQCKADGNHASTEPSLVIFFGECPTDSDIYFEDGVLTGSRSLPLNGVPATTSDSGIAFFATQETRV